MGSPNFGRHVAVQLSVKIKNKCLFHVVLLMGIVLSDTAIVAYKVDKFIHQHVNTVWRLTIVTWH